MPVNLNGHHLSSSCNVEKGLVEIKFSYLLLNFYRIIMTSVSVLAPNGRRQTVKVTPNTTLLQVLEDVCKKQGLNPDEYNIKHFNKILDLSMAIRFSGLPNNAQLELVRAQTLRQESKVHIALQVGDSTTRVTADFWPSDSLIDVVQTLSSDYLNAETKIPVVIYMRKEVIGVDALHTTLLKSLGLTRGSAVLRLVLRDNDLPPEQKTSGSAVYFRPPPADTIVPNVPCPQEIASSVEAKNKDISISGEAMDLSSSSPEESLQPASFSTLPQTVPLELTHPLMKTENESQGNNQGVESEPSVSSQACSAALGRLNNTNQEDKESVVLSEESNKMEISPVESIEEVINYVGERNALIFNQADINSGPEQEIPDDFFDLTINDLRTLTRDYKRKVKELEDNPFQTAAQRELQQSKQTLNRLNYKSTVIRIQFPDRLVLQGVFSPVDTVFHVMEFVRKFLQQPDIEFHLYMTPPKVVLDPESHLVEVDCVPRALIYFGAPNCDVNLTYLHSSYLSNLTTARQASKAALQQVRKVNTVESDSLDDSVKSEEKDRQSEDSVSAVDYVIPQNRPSTSNSNQPKQFVPKWFKK